MIIQRAQFSLFLLGNEREKKKGELKHKNKNYNLGVLYHPSSLASHEPNQHINGMKIDFLDGDNQALSQH